MTPFDLMFMAVMAVLLVIIAAELWYARTRPPPKDDVEPWVQVRPPDERG